MYKIARVGLHHFEEPCLSGERGSGTIFFSGCNLRCLFCQNYEISHGGKGLEVSESELVDCMLYLQDIGAHNINLVTPSNYTNLLQSTLENAKPIVKLPIVWNSSGYETVANLKKMDGLVDVYLPDFKYSDDDLAWEYSHAKGYREVALAALEEMRRQQPNDVFDNDEMMQKGVIVRHLVCRANRKHRGCATRHRKRGQEPLRQPYGTVFPDRQRKKSSDAFKKTYDKRIRRSDRLVFFGGVAQRFFARP